MAEHLEHLPLPPPETQRHRVVTWGPERRLPDREPGAHARHLSEQIERVESELGEIAERPRPEDSVGYLVATTFAEESDPNLDGLSDKRSGTKLIDVNAVQRRALFYAPRPKLRSLRTKVRHYADPTKVSKSTGLPRNAPLVAPLETLALATLVDISDGWLREDTRVGETTWVEAWARGGRSAGEEERERIKRALREFLQGHELGVDQLRSFAATEHDIYLLELSDQALMDLPAQLPEVFHLSPPQRTVVPHMLDAQTEVDIPEVAKPPAGAVTTTILDTGIAERHPLLASTLLGTGRSVVVGDVNADDSQGHGTKMAGLSAYRDLGAELAAGGPLSPRCRIQNVRILAGSGDPNQIPEFMADRTCEGVAVAEQTEAPRRVFSLSLGSVTAQPGASTPWSVAVDQLANDGNRLICVAAGNHPVHGPPDPMLYPNANLAAGLTSPGEAMNAITVGAVTDLTDLEEPADGRSPLASAGQLNPASRCDVAGNRPVKPDVVVEGGNLSTDGQTCRGDKSMQLLTTSSKHVQGTWLTTASMTSAATARLAGLCAEVWQDNPDRWPQTVRGLMVHSARWTPAMHGQFPDRVDRLRAVGYGLPRLERAIGSATAAPTTIFQGLIHPMRSLDPGREMHFHRLPLPDDELRQLGNTEVELSVTLSYFAEPNESRIVRYAAAGLRWDIQRPLENEVEFRKRINKLEREDGERPGPHPEKLPWEVGIDARSRGTIQSDRARLAASQLLDTRAIAVWPVQGWWHDRDVEGDPAIPYSLIVTIDAGEQEIDLYSPILTQISIRTEV